MLKSVQMGGGEGKPQPYRQRSADALLWRPARGYWLVKMAEDTYTWVRRVAKPAKGKAAVKAYKRARQRTREAARLGAR